MKPFLAIPELCDLIGTENLLQPEMKSDVRAKLGEAAQIIETVGLPKQFADWFACFRMIELAPKAQRSKYHLSGVRQTIKRAVAVGQSDFGIYVIDCDTGALVYVDPPHDTQLINTSIERFLQFVAHFNIALRQEFGDTAAMRNAFETIDSEPLSNAEGIWALTLESAEAGLF